MLQKLPTLASVVSSCLPYELFLMRATPDLSPSHAAPGPAGSHVRCDTLAYTSAGSINTHLALYQLLTIVDLNMLTADKVLTVAYETKHTT